MVIRVRRQRPGASFGATTAASETFRPVKRAAWQLPDQPDSDSVSDARERVCLNMPPLSRCRLTAGDPPAAPLPPAQACPHAPGGKCSSRPPGTE